MNQTLTAPRGFKVAALKAGIKPSGKLDLGLIVADGLCSAAGVFTTNKVVSPTITVSRSHVRNGRARAVFVNAGNANACTGAQGLKDAQEICQLVAEGVGCRATEVLVTSTGIIGHYLPMEKVRAGIGRAVETLTVDAAMGEELARAIMTTDLVMKSAYRKVKIGGKMVQIAGICKGSGMIAPNMATMLAYITTDANIKPSLLKRALRHGAGLTFNKVTVDNHVSTNDAALVLASGLAGHALISEVDDPGYQVFEKALWQVCDDLARQIARDGEGATRAITIRVKSASNAGDARKAVRAIADSPLVRCAFHGADPNWGRIVSAVGYSQAAFDESKMTCKIAGIMVYRNGRPTQFNADQVSEKMKGENWDVVVDLGVGECDDLCYTCDLSREYITINADYHT